MKCWYVYGEDCERHGICEGCPKYEDWRKQRDEIQFMNELKMKAEKYNGYPPNLIPESIWRADFKRWKEEKNKNKGDENE